MAQNAINPFGNSFGTTSKEFAAGKYIWHEVKAKYPVGGVVDLSSYAVGDVIPAGSMLYFNQSTKAVSVILASDTAGLANVNGLLENDIFVDEAAKGTYGAVTATPVYAGEIYIDRVAQAIPDSVLANLPQIVAIHEA